MTKYGVTKKSLQSTYIVVILITFGMGILSVRSLPWYQAVLAASCFGLAGMLMACFAETVDMRDEEEEDEHGY